MSKLEELKRYCSEKVVSDDVIMALFSLLNNNELPKNPAVIHTSIYELKPVPDFEPLLDFFDFDCSGIVPFSDELDQVLFRLETASLLRTFNPTYERYEIRKDLLEKALNKFNDEDKKRLKNMADTFQQKVLHNEVGN
ncbi:MAG: hypothetical protein GXX09_12710 [Syntrophomonadaceae bacterium]|nr:hypothetical protein [Syntrophomonadaceae bacterium]